MSEISVIVPVYNVQKYLKQCVHSILMQTFKDFELILIDDGATDQSGAMCDELAKEDSRIIVYHKQNEGLGTTRKYGFERSNGKYVTFIDSDDYISSDYLERLYSTAKNKNAELVVSGYTKTSDEGTVLFTSIPKAESFRGKDVKNMLLPRMIGSLPDRTDSIFIAVTGKLYQKNILLKNKVRFFSEREIQSEDLAFQLEAIPFFHSAEVIEYSGYQYRANPQSLSMKYKPERFDELKKVYLYTLDKMMKLKLPQETKYRIDKMLYVQLLTCLLQENPKINNASAWDCIKKIKSMISDTVVRKSVNAYPINKLDFKKKIYVLLLKYNFSVALYILLTMGKI